MIASINIKEFGQSLEFLLKGNKSFNIAVGVSGGGDSMALAVLANEWAKRNSSYMIALTVDHKLRAESTEEAKYVNKTLTDMGITHEILSWNGKKPDTHIEEIARNVRYDLLINRCKELGFNHLAIAHNIEDQAETFWMRLAHGSGLDGLAAMSAKRDIKGISIIRPLISFSRGRLRATCRKYNINWVDDPFNKDKKYLRVKLREFENMLSTEGFTPLRLTKVIKKLDNARQAIKYLTEIAIKECRVINPAGYALLKKEYWLKYPVDIRQRVLSDSLQKISPKKYSSGFDAIEDICLGLMQKEFLGKTLSGCEIFLDKAGDILISREENNIEPNIFIKDNIIWDKRFKCNGVNNESFTLGILGQKGLIELRKNKKLFKAIEHLPFKVKKVLPAIWLEDKLLAVPHIGYYSCECPKDLRNISIIFVNS